MRMREHRLTMKDSLSTAMEVDNREHLVRLIFDRFGKRGITISDEMIHVSHYGFDDRIDWDDHIIVVDGQGVFGFTDAPCPGSGSRSAAARKALSRSSATRFPRLTASKPSHGHVLNGRRFSHFLRAVSARRAPLVVRPVGS